jgi:hypothetical protein
MASKEKFITPKKKVKAFKKPDIILDRPKKGNTTKKIAAAALGGAVLGATVGSLVGSKSKKCSPIAQRYVDEIESVTTANFEEIRRIKNKLVADLNRQIESNNKKLLETQSANKDLTNELSVTKLELEKCKRELAKNAQESIKMGTEISSLRRILGRSDNLSEIRNSDRQ